MTKLILVQMYVGDILWSLITADWLLEEQIELINFFVLLQGRQPVCSVESKFTY